MRVGQVVNWHNLDSIEHTATLGVEKFHSRFREVARRFIQARAQQLGERIAGLILKGQFFLPPAQQFPAMFLDHFIAGI